MTSTSGDRRQPGLHLQHAAEPEQEQRLQRRVMRLGVDGDRGGYSDAGEHYSGEPRACGLPVSAMRAPSTRSDWHRGDAASGQGSWR